MSGDNAGKLDSSIVWISIVFTSDHENFSMQCLYHHSCCYGYPRVVEVETATIKITIQLFVNSVNIKYYGYHYRLNE